jgi:acetyl esterase/lipase
VRTDHVVVDTPVPVRVHRPVGHQGFLPCILSLHGGGLVVGTHLADDALFDRWCPDLGVVGVSVDYRLAPEDPYPAALDDAYAALAWIHAHAAVLGVDPARIGLRGVSAGAGIAAAVALLARDRGGPPVAFQLLDAPMLDDRQITASSRLDGLPVWPREANAFGWRCYLGDRYGSDDVPHTAAPARATDLSGLPPAFVSVGAVDGFRDEAVDYATRLNQAGVPCELHVYAGTPHGYTLAPTAPVTHRATHDKTTWLHKITTP